MSRFVAVAVVVEYKGSQRVFSVAVSAASANPERAAAVRIERKGYRVVGAYVFASK